MLEQRTGIDIPLAKSSLDFPANAKAKLITIITVH